ncbi:MAG TPA: ferrous iron transport protein A [Syntrophus sp. (in: bacteria)]|nr:ferrous iron transport protein A [Syntrophus sp. (in: bacteria)]
MLPLSLLKEGEIAEIINFSPGGDLGSKNPGYQEHLQDMGLRPGQRVEMIKNQGWGPLLLRVDEMRIALGQGLAVKIRIRRIES